MEFYRLGLALCSLMMLAAEGHAQTWTRVADWPHPPVLAKTTNTPSNATPFWRGWTKPVYDPREGGLLNYLANPNCCGGTFSNALFLYKVKTNSWNLVWSDMRTDPGKGPADAADAPSDNHPYHAIAWDSKRHVLWKGFGSAAHGGLNGNCGDCGVSDLYKFDPDNGKWTEVCGNGMTSCPPGAPQEAAFVYDPRTDSILMYGGLYGGTPSDDTWQYYPASNTWKHVCGQPKAPCGPPPLHREGLVYDAALDRVVLFSGGMRRGRLSDETWLYDSVARRWSHVQTEVHPPAQYFPVMDYVPRLQSIVLIGGERGGAHTWAFDGKHWSDLQISGAPVLSDNWKQNQGGYDTSADRFVLFLPAGESHVASIWSLSLPSSLAPTASEFIDHSAPAEAKIGSLPVQVLPVTDPPQKQVVADLEIPLTIQEPLYGGFRSIPRHQDPVTVGIPLPDSAAIKSPSQLGISGAPLAQFEVLGRWPDGNAKWILVDTDADVPRDTAAPIAVTLGAGNFGGPNLATDEGSTISVNTGAATFSIRKSKFDLIDQATVGNHVLIRAGASSGLVIAGPVPGETRCPCSTLYASSNDRESTATVEENGPARSVIKATGQFEDEVGHAYMRFTVRLFFYRNKTWIKAVTILQNADFGPSNSFGSAYKEFSAFEARLMPDLGAERSFSFGTAGSPARGTFAGAENAYLYQAYSNKMEDCDWVAPGSGSTVRSYIERTLLKKNACQSVWRYAQEGYQVNLGHETVTRGSRSNYAAGWADIHDSSGAGVEIGVYQLAAYWPKSLQFVNGGSEIRIGIWPDQSLYGTGGETYFQSWPQYSIHSLFFNFHDQPLQDPAKEFDKFEHPLIARAPRGYYNETQALMYPLPDPNTEDKYLKSLGLACCIGELKSPHVYRTYGWPAGGGGNQAEMRWSDLMLWLQRGYADRYVNSANFYTFQAEQVFPRSDYKGEHRFHWRDEPQSELDVQGFPDGIASLNEDLGCDSGFKRCGRNWIDTQHAHWYGMIDYYFLTGDQTIRDAIEDGASDTYGNPDVRLAKNGLYWAARDVGVALMSNARLALFYRAVGDQAAADRAVAAGDEILANQVWPELDVSGFGSARQGVSRTRGLELAIGNSKPPRFAKPFQQGILEEGLWEFLQAHGPDWPHFWDTFDLAYGIGTWALTEGWATSGKGVGCRQNSSFTYEVLIDQLDQPPVPGCSQTCWFDLYDVAKYTGDSVTWRAKFEQYLRHLNGHGSFYEEYGTIFASALVYEALHPGAQKLADVSLNVSRANDGHYLISWQVPPGAKLYRIKYSDKQIVSWLDFNPATDSFGLDPNSHIPWFAATSIENPPPPGAANSTQELEIKDLDPAKSWHFAMKAYVENPKP